MTACTLLDIGFNGFSQDKRAQPSEKFAIKARELRGFKQP